MLRKKLVVCSPGHPHNVFAVISNDLRLFELKTEATTCPMALDGSPSRVVVGEKQTQIQLLGSCSEIQNAKCVAWSHVVSGQASLGHIVSGLSSGTAILTAFSGEGRSTVLKQFVPQNSRSCNYLAWNPHHPSQFAVAMEKVRNDFSVLVWDVDHSEPSRPPPSRGPLDRKKGRKEGEGGSGNSFSLSALDAVEVVSSPVAQVLNSESASSLCWLLSHPNVLAIGTGAKWLRLCDLRKQRAEDSNNAVMAHTKSITGIAINPFVHHEIMSFSEDGKIKIWDVRNIHPSAKPITVIDADSKALNHVAWSPTRPGIVASSSRDEKAIRLWRVSSPDSSDSPDSLLITKPIKVHSCPEVVTHFGWHHKSEHRVLTIAESGSVQVHDIYESLPFSWSPSGSFFLGSGKQMSEVSLHLSLPHRGPFDESAVMRQRAVAGYSYDMAHNEENVVPAHQGLFGREVQTLVRWMVTISSISDRYSGVHSLICREKSDSIPHQVGPEGPTVYDSPQRKKAQQMCGWGNPSPDTQGHAGQSARDVAREAAIAVFQMDLRRAVGLLNNGARSSAPSPPSGASSSASGQSAGQGQGQGQGAGINWKLLSLALAGFNLQSPHPSNALWQETCRDLSAQLDDPYLRVLFAFLCEVSSPSSSKDFLSIVHNPLLSLADRIAFACSFLPDLELQSFVEEMTMAAKENGDLSGILLTGLSPDGVDLMQRYVDLSGDVQTAALVMTHAVPGVFRDERVEGWLLSYRELLNVWTLWHQRALLDVSLTSSSRYIQQVYVKCNFCRQNLSLSEASNSKPVASRYSVKTRGGPQEKLKISGCPYCKKPLPKCAVCVLPLNCSLPAVDAKQSRRGPELSDEWFTWCQTCRHGGHQQHITEWFANHSECPVTDCDCQCMSL